MSLEWEARLRGESPVVKDEQTSQTYLGFVKESGIRHKKLNNQNFPFILPGMGSSGSSCMCKKAWGIGINGDKLGYINLKCKRIECPNCYVNWMYDAVFEDAVKVEAYSKVVGERPCHITSEVIGISQIAHTWTLVDYDNFHKRVYRHVRSVGGCAGLRGFHPYKIHSHIKEQLRQVGYGVPGNGYWKGVRENALNLPFPDAYYYYLSPHDHCIVFPSYLEQHQDNQFFLKKIGELETVADTVKTLFYLYSHVGVLKGTEEKDNHPVVPFGGMHGFVPENFLTEWELLHIKKDVAEAMGMRFFNDELQPMKEKESNKDEFYPLSEFIMYSREQDEWINAIVSSFPGRYRSFWMDVILEYNQKISDTSLEKDKRHLFLDDVLIPEGIEVVEVI